MGKYWMSFGLLDICSLSAGSCITQANSPDMLLGSVQRQNYPGGTDGCTEAMHGEEAFVVTSVRKRSRSGLGFRVADLGFFCGWLSGPIRPGLAGLQISAGFRVIRCD